MSRKDTLFCDRTVLGGANAAAQLLGKKGFEVPPALKAGLKSHFGVINSGKYFVAK